MVPPDKSMRKQESPNGPEPVEGLLELIARPFMRSGEETLDE